MAYKISSHIKNFDKGIPVIVIESVANNDNNKTYQFTRKDGELGKCDIHGVQQLRREGSCSFEGLDYNIVTVLTPCCERIVSHWKNGIAPLRQDQIDAGITKFIRPCEKCGANIVFTAEMKTHDQIDAHLAGQECRKPMSQPKPASYYKKQKKKKKEGK